MITVKDLCFSYTQKPFIEHVGFDVRAGEIFGFLGPSGAGKSTLQKILTGLLAGFRGSVTVGDVAIGRHDNSFYESIGVDFEFPSLYEKLTARENLKFFASLYKKQGDIDGLMDQVGLLPDADKKVSDFSKGMKSRLNFIKALLHDPQILFLDEPTSGLDPSNARIAKNMILAEQMRGKTIILTTHNMYDAAELCTRVAFIVDGAIRALDTPRALVMSKGAHTVTYSYMTGGTERNASVPLDKTSDDALLKQLVVENRLVSIHSGEPTLNDIFMDVTGRQLV